MAHQARKRGDTMLAGYNPPQPMKPFWSKFVRYLAARRMLPRSALARFTVYFVLPLWLLFVALRALLAITPAESLSAVDAGLIVLRFLLVTLLIVLGFRWVQNVMLWRLRNRLLVTYFFIGVVPAILIALMAFVSMYLLAGQYATAVAVGEVHSQVQRLDAANRTILAEASRRLKAGDPQWFRTLETLAQVEGLRDREVAAIFRGRSFSSSKSPLIHDTQRPGWMKENLGDLVQDEDRFFLRAVSSTEVNGAELIIISSIPVNNEWIQEAATGLGELKLYSVGDTAAGQNDGSTGSKDSSGGIVIGAGQQRGLTIRRDGRTVRLNQEEAVQGGTQAPPRNILDRQIIFGAPLRIRDWDTGQETDVLLGGVTRLSTLYNRLGAYKGNWSSVILTVLIALALVFGFIVLLALFVGLGLTRTITRSVAALYAATQHVNRGDFSHRIKVKSKDQLAALESSFNSMTESIERLIQEQKEKERLQSELAIAQEVQKQLFPPLKASIATLEVHGVCHPARIVSGDYYDFLPLGEEKMALAVGDISGKGISAALLMATVHSAVRAYEFGRMPETAELVAAGAAAITLGVNLKGMAQHQAPNTAGLELLQSPANVLWLLNRHLYHSTPPEKYATLFLGFYDGHRRKLTYGNAGHLPPIILGKDDSVRRLEPGGTVVGLLDNMTYEESTVDFRPGDIYVAYSDGITEPENEFGEFGEQRVLDIVRANRHLPLERISEMVIAAVRDWIGANEQPDDLTLVLARPR